MRASLVRAAPSDVILPETLPERGWVLSGRRLRFCRPRFDETTARTRPEDRKSDAGNAATEGCFAGKPGKGQKKASRLTCQAKIAEPEESPITEAGSNEKHRLPNYVPYDNYKYRHRAAAL